MSKINIKKEFQSIFLLNLKKDSQKEDFEKFFCSFTKIDKRINEIFEENLSDKNVDNQRISVLKDLHYYLKILKDEILNNNSKTLKEIIEWNLNLIY